MQRCGRLVDLLNGMFMLILCSLDPSFGGKREHIRLSFVGTRFVESQVCPAGDKAHDTQQTGDIELVTNQQQDETNDKENTRKIGHLDPKPALEE